jgi:fluoroacetyl-CoA thioesterase
MELKVGLKGERKIMVTDNNTAIAYGSGGVAVFATPAMIGLMENAALNVAQDCLPEGQTTVGTKIEVSHLAATPVGMEVTATAEITEIEGRKIVFKVEAFDGKDKIGTGTHERFIIDLEKFMSKVKAKK